MKQQQSLIDFPAPESLSAERQVLADLAANSDCIPDVVELITPEMFSTEETRNIWETMVGMYNAGESIDAFTLRMRCGKSFSENVLLAVSDVGGPVSTLQHAKELRDQSARRRAYNAACWLLEKSTAPGGSEEDMVVAASKIADRFQATQKRGDISLDGVMKMLEEDVERREQLAREGRSASIPSGIPSLDRALGGGWEPGQLVILAARPSVGKTALMLQLARTAAERGTSVMIFSLEMTELQLGKRLVLSTGEVSREQLAGGSVDWERFRDAARQVASWPITINATSVQASDIVSKITTAVARSRCGIGFIDYLGLVKGGGTLKEMTNAQRIGEITKSLKIAAKRCGIPLVVLAQLNREKDKGSGREPQLTDLRDSGDIEQDADIVLMLDQKDKVVESDGGAQERNIMVMWVRKMREGIRNFCIELLPNESYTRFIEIQNEL